MRVFEVDVKKKHKQNENQYFSWHCTQAMYILTASGERVKNYSKMQHPFFIFRTSWVRIFDWRLAILTKVSVVFITPPSHML